MDHPLSQLFSYRPQLPFSSQPIVSLPLITLKARNLDKVWLAHTRHTKKRRERGGSSTQDMNFDIRSIMSFTTGSHPSGQACICSSLSNQSESTSSHYPIPSKFASRPKVSRPRRWLRYRMDGLKPKLLPPLLARLFCLTIAPRFYQIAYGSE